MTRVTSHSKAIDDQVVHGVGVEAFVVGLCRLPGRDRRLLDPRHVGARRRGAAHAPHPGRDAEDTFLDAPYGIQKPVHPALVVHAETRPRPLRILQHRIEHALLAGHALLRLDRGGAGRVRLASAADDPVEDLERIHELVHRLRGAGPRDAAAAGAGLAIAVAERRREAHLERVERRLALEAIVLGQHLIDRNAVGLVEPESPSHGGSVDTGQPRSPSRL